VAGAAPGGGGGARRRGRRPAAGAAPGGRGSGRGSIVVARRLPHPPPSIIGPAGNRIEHASSMHRAASAIEGGIRWGFLGASEPPSKCFDRCRATADNNPTPRAFLSDRLHFETRAPFQCALCAGSSANDWSSYCTLWIRAPTGMLLTVEGTGTGIPRECDQKGAVSTTSLPARGL